MKFLPQSMMRAMQSLNILCLHHMYANFRKRFPSKNLNRLMWKATSSTYTQACERKMRNIKNVNE